MSSLNLEQRINSNSKNIVKTIKLIFISVFFVLCLIKFLLSFREFDTESILNAKYLSISSKITQLTCIERDWSKGFKGTPGRISIMLKGAPHLLHIDLGDVVSSKKCSGVKYLFSVGDSLTIKLKPAWNEIVYLETQERVLFSLEEYILNETEHYNGEKGFWGSLLFAYTIAFAGWNLRRSKVPNKFINNEK